MSANDLGQVVDPSPGFGVEGDGRLAAKAVRDTYGFTGAGQTVAVVDTGIAYDHVGLGSGYGPGFRVVGGYDFSAENDPDPYDDGLSGVRGTHVAGVIGNASGENTGVAPEVDFVALRVFDDDGNGYFDAVENALQWVIDNQFSFQHPITTVNLSLSVDDWNSDALPTWSTLEDEFAQLKAMGVFITAAAGDQYMQHGAQGLTYPAVSPSVVPVMSVDDDGMLSFYSQRDATAIAAPGRSITSTVPDRFGNNNGVVDDYGTFSGTGMAAPYVAGVSVLVREAMEFVGRENITQDIIFDHLTATADRFFDTESLAWYNRVNLAAAIDALMPPDDYGSTGSTAYDLGELDVGSAFMFDGLITSAADVDFFEFTAGFSGTITFDAIRQTHRLDVLWDVEGGPWRVVGATGEKVAIQVVEGESYQVSLSTGKGSGYFEVEISTQPQSDLPDWGVVSQGTIRGVSIAGENWMQFTAMHEGLFTVAVVESSGGDLMLELYRSDGSTPITSGQSRIDVQASVGEQFVLRMDSSDAEIELQVVNLVSQQDDVIWIGAGGGDNAYRLVGGGFYEVVVNGVGYRFALNEATEFRFQGGPGVDSISLVDTGDAGVYVSDVESIKDLDAIATTLNEDLGLYFTGNDFFNWLGYDERWVHGDNDQWYYITPTGEFYHYDYNEVPTTLIAHLERGHYEDLATITEAVFSDFTNTQRAASLDRSYALLPTDSYAEDWGGWGEKWIRSENEVWFFITPTGDLYRWNGALDLAESARVATLDPSFHANPTRLHDASGRGSLIHDLAGVVDAQFGLQPHANDYKNWGGWNEIWVKGEQDWFFITPSGGFYKWHGNQNLAGSALVAVFDESFHEDPSLVRDADQPPVELAMAAAADERPAPVPAASRAAPVRSSDTSVNGVSASSQRLPTNVAEASLPIVPRGQESARITSEAAHRAHSKLYTDRCDDVDDPFYLAALDSAFAACHV